MQPIKDLKMEHDAVQVTLRILDKICQQFEISGKKFDIQHMDELLEFFRVFVDKCHHGKEEELLFPALETIGVSHKGGPIGVMLHEHQQGSEYVRTMAKEGRKMTIGIKTRHIMIGLVISEILFLYSINANAHCDTLDGQWWKPHAKHLLLVISHRCSNEFPMMMNN